MKNKMIILQLHEMKLLQKPLSLMVMLKRKLLKKCSSEDEKDEVFPDEIYENQSKQFISVKTHNSECGVARTTAASKSVFD